MVSGGKNSVWLICASVPAVLYHSQLFDFTLCSLESEADAGFA